MNTIPPPPRWSLTIFAPWKVTKKTPNRKQVDFQDPSSIPTHPWDRPNRTAIQEKLLVDKASRMKEAKERLDQAVGIFLHKTKIL